MNRSVVILLLTISVFLSVSFTMQAAGCPHAKANEQPPCMAAQKKAAAEDKSAPASDVPPKEAFSAFLENSSFDNFKVALDSLNKATANEPENPIPFLWTAAACATYMDTMVEKLIAWDNEKPLQHMPRFQLANLLSSIGRYEEAVSLYDKVIASTPDWSCPYRHRGDALAELGKNDEAIASYSRSIEIQPDHLDAVVALGLLQNKLGKTSEAEKNLLLALEKMNSAQCEEPVGWAEVYSTLAEIKEKAGDKTAAANYKAKAEELNKKQEQAKDAAVEKKQETGDEKAPPCMKGAESKKQEPADSKTHSCAKGKEEKKPE